MDRLTTVQHALEHQTNNLVFISSQNCGVCHADEPKARELARKHAIYFYHLDIVEEPALAGYFEVLTVPALLVYHQGKEVARQARFIDFHALEKILLQLPKDPEAIDYQSLFKEKD